MQKSIFIIAFSYDWNEDAVACQSKEEVFDWIEENLEPDSEHPKGTSKWWEDAEAAYNDDDWKAMIIVEVALPSGKITVHGQLMADPA